MRRSCLTQLLVECLAHSRLPSSNLNKHEHDWNPGPGEGGGIPSSSVALNESEQDTESLTLGVLVVEMCLTEELPATLQDYRELQRREQMQERI